MTGGQVALFVSQVVVGAVAVAGTLLVVVALSRRGTPPRAWIPGAAVVALLLATLLALALPMAGLQAHSAGYVWFGAFPLLAATYPDGRFVPRWFIAPVVLLLGFMLAAFATGGAITDQPWWVTVPLSGVGLVVGQVYRYRFRATTPERQRLRWALLGIILSVESYLLIGIVSGASIGEGGPGWLAAANLAIVPALAGFVIGLARPRLRNVDAALHGLLAVTVAATALAGLYRLTTTITSTLTPASDAASGWVGAIIVAATAMPVIRMAAQVASWIVYRGRADAATAVTALGRAVAAEPQSTLVPETILRSVVASLYLDGAVLRTADGVIAKVGTVDGPTEGFPVVYLGTELAKLVVPPRPGESELTVRDRAVADALALHAAPALHGAQVLAELTEAHAELLTAHEEERRRLRRDLHDDLAPSLAGLGMSAAAIARRTTRSGTDPQLAAIADELQRDIRSVIARAREISHDLRPAVLDELGLVAAIRSRLAEPRPGEVVVRLEADEPLPLPAAVDVAALRIVQEAVSNVRRHASARTCTIALHLDATHLDVTVRDDGVGIPASAPRGLGIDSILERARELGGTAEIGSAPDGGGRVHVRLPLARSAA